METAMVVGFGITFIAIEIAFAIIKSEMESIRKDIHEILRIIENQMEDGKGEN